MVLLCAALNVPKHVCMHVIILGLKENSQMCSQFFNVSPDFQTHDPKDGDFEGPAYCVLELGTSPRFGPLIRGAQHVIKIS